MIRDRMSKEEFMWGVDKLRDVFGERAFPEARVNLLARKVKFLNYTEWASVVDDVIGYVSTTPNLSHFDKILQPYRAAWNANADQRFSHEMAERYARCDGCKGTGCPRCKCVHCDDLGCVIAFPIGNHHNAGTAFRCPDRSCAAGEFRNGPSMPFWKDDMAEKWVLASRNETTHSAWERANPATVEEQKRNSAAGYYRDRKMSSAGSVAQKVVEEIKSGGTFQSEPRRQENSLDYEQDEAYE